MTAQGPDMKCPFVLEQGSAKAMSTSLLGWCLDPAALIGPTLVQGYGGVTLTASVPALDSS